MHHTRDMRIIAMFMAFSTFCFVLSFIETISISLVLAIMSVIFAVCTASATILSIWFSLDLPVEDDGSRTL